MINEKNVKQYCKGDISKIENYDKAIADKTQTWECHHRRETIYSKFDLIEINEYYNRPAIELIFLTPKEHKRLHKIGKKRSDETKRKMSESMIGKNVGKKHTEETKQKMSKSRIGEGNGMFGKNHTEETKRKISESKKGKIPWNKGKKKNREN